MGVLDNLVRSSAAQPVLSAVVSGNVGGHAFLLDAENLPVARWFANFLGTGLACLSSGEKPCGCCVACSSARSIHVREIVPMGVEFRIQQIHQILSECSLALGPGEKLVYLLVGVESMNEESANAFLKLLEEPPAAVVFVLATAAIRQVLPTIRSRCHALHVDFPPATALVTSELASSQVPHHWLLAALEVWGGTPGLIESAALPGDAGRSPRAPSSPDDEVDTLLAHYKRKPAALLADPAAGIFSDLAHALDTTGFFLRSLGRVLQSPGALSAFAEAARVHDWADGLKEAVSKGLVSLEAERRKVYGPAYVHPLLEEDSFEKSYYRKVTLMAFEAFFRAALLSARIALQRGQPDRRGPEPKLFDRLLAELPSLGRLQPASARRVASAVEAARGRLHANVTARYALEAFFLAVAPEPIALSSTMISAASRAGRA